MQEGEGDLRLSLISWLVIQSIKTVSWNPNKNSGHLKLPWASRWLILNNVPGGSRIMRTGNVFVWDPLRPHPLCLFIWLVPVCRLYYKVTILSIMLSWILWVILADYRTWGGSGKPQICSQWVRSMSGLRACNWCLKWGECGGALHPPPVKSDPAPDSESQNGTADTYTENLSTCSKCSQGAHGEVHRTLSLRMSNTFSSCLLQWL